MAAVQKLVIDLFAGGGGASLGMARAIKRSPDIAINHDAAAIKMHEANHPSTIHIREDLWKANSRKITVGRPVGLLWASPDCTHFSRAKGGKPVKKEIRSLAWVVVQWAIKERPDLIILENVREFQDWGPLLPAWECSACSWKGTEGQATLVRKHRRCPRCDSRKLVITDEQLPNPEKRGLTFKQWVGRLRNLGYQVQWKVLNAADFGAPTHRRRLFVVARCDGNPICWPEPTHGDPKKLDDTPLFDRLKPYRAAAECIDWSISCPSIFDPEARKAAGLKPVLAEKTLKRIAMGLKRYVLENPNPFIVQVNHGGDEFRGQSLDEPMPTVTGKHGYGIVSPYVVGVGGRAGQSPATGGNAPLGTVTAKGDKAIVIPTLVQTGYGERDGQAPRSLDIESPLGTVVAAGQKHALVSAFVQQYFGGVVGKLPTDPLPTVTSIDHNAVVAAYLSRICQTGGNGSYCNSAGSPLTTIVSKQEHTLAAVHLTKFRGESQGVSIGQPMPTITSGAGSARPAGAPHALGIAAAYLARFNHGDKQWNGVNEPLGVITSQGNKFGLVYAFLVKYFGTAVGSDLLQPLHTVTAKHRFGLVMVEIVLGQYEPAVAIHVPGIGMCLIADIGLRMLTPRELARAQGFPDTYVIAPMIDRHFKRGVTKTVRMSTSKQVAKIGNSVPPTLAQVMVESNYCECLTEAA